MMNSMILKELVLENVSLGLADSFRDADPPFTIAVCSEEEPETGAEVFFGISLPIDDIAEVRGKVLSCEKSDDEKFAVAIEILGLDNRYADMLNRILKGEKEAAADTEGRRPLWGHGIKQTDGTFATLVNCPGGLLSAAQLAKLAEITKKGAGLAKLTHAQRVILLLKPEQLETIREELNSAGLNIGVLHHGIRNIRACCGKLCEMSQGLDGLGLATEIDKAVFGEAAKFNVKIAISDCPRNCLEGFCVDIGLVGNSRAYDVFVGGVSSSVHFKGLKLTRGIPPEKIISLLRQILKWYEKTAQENERLYRTLERLGYPEAEGKSRYFSEASAVFDPLDIGDDMLSRLERTLSRGYGLLKMRSDLGVTS
jgi:NAD(P)H-nitrite reductase large subunit